MKYFRGTIFINVDIYNDMKRYLRREVRSFSYNDKIDVRDYKLEIQMEGTSRDIELSLTIKDKRGKQVVKDSTWYSKVSQILGLKKIICESNIYLVNITKGDNTYETEISNLHLLSWNCRSEKIYVEDFINFFDLGENIDVMKFIFAVLTKVGDVHNCNLSNTIKDKLSYYGYEEEDYKLFSSDSDEAVDMKNSSEEIMEQCFSVLYYHINNSEIDIDYIKNYIYKKYDEYLTALEMEGVLA